jgi:SAM-dependent methyltransferase
VASAAGSGACAAAPSAIREAVRAKYRAVAAGPAGHFPYPVGREGLARLGYLPGWLAPVPAPLLDGFAGIGNPFGLRLPARGERVLDAGCGAAVDAFVAAHLVGPSGRVAGADLSAEMLAAPRREAARSGPRNLHLLQADLESLPFPDGSFDLVLSNGSLNLVPGKEAAYGELARVLRPGGMLAAADLAVVETIPGEVLRDMDAWST